MIALSFLKSVPLHPLSPLSMSHQEGPDDTVCLSTQKSPITGQVQDNPTNP